ncbi:MAG: hypothetical protein GY801_21500, partial [bacterium]|nr:hypothetical protein [bacterium]
MENKDRIWKFFNAVKANDIENVKQCVAEGVDVNAEDPELGQPEFALMEATALMHAAEKGYAQLVTLLFTHGAHVDATDVAGHTALMYAIPHIEIVKRLIEHGANINVRDSDGSTALKRALHRGAVDIVRMLIEHGAKIADEIHTKNDNQARLIKASIQNDVKSVRRLLAKGGIEDVDAPDECDKLTPLMYAALCGSTETIKMLLEYGADVNARGGWVMEYGIWIPG